MFVQHVKRQFRQRQVQRLQELPRRLWMLDHKVAQRPHGCFQSRSDPVAGVPGNQINRNQIETPLFHFLL